MPVQILMPALSPTMTEGKLAKWLKKEGEAVKPGQVIAEIETDKATMEVEAVDAGIVGKILVPAGTEGVKVNALIAVLLQDGETEADIAKMPAAPALKTVTPANQPAPAKSAAPLAVAPRTVPSKEGRVFASPLARRLARERGIDLSRLRGSGPRGRIVKADVERGMDMPAPYVHKASGPDAKTLADAYGIPYKLSAHSAVRKVIAKRLTESKQFVPHFYLSTDCRLDALMEARKAINAAGDVKVSVNDFVIKALALALEKCPAANVSWMDDQLVQYARVDVSVAVATDNGLITPIIKDAARKSLKDISAEMKDLAARAKEGKLKPQEFQGGTVSLSNLGMFGVREFSAIINPPQASILAVGAGEQKPVVRDGKVEIATIMSATMSLDHRAIDGAVGAEFLQAFKTLIENPSDLTKGA